MIFQSQYNENGGIVIPRFFYTVIAPNGHLKSGTIKSPDRESAYYNLSFNGLRIKDIYEAPEQLGASQEQNRVIIETSPDKKDSATRSATQDESLPPHAASSGKDYHIELPEELKDYCKSPPTRKSYHIDSPEVAELAVQINRVIGDRQTSSSISMKDVWKSIIPSSPYIRAAMLILVIFSIASILTGMASIRKPPQRIESLNLVEISIRGTVALGGEGQPQSGTQRSLDDMHLTFHFPEIPLDLERNSRNLNLDQKGNFEAHFSFYSRKAPEHFYLVIGKKGFEEKELNALPLYGSPCSYTISSVIVLSPKREQL